MSETSTFIKLDRNILKWGWYTDNITKAVFIHLILNANIEDKEWLGYKVKRGQFVTSFSHLAKDLGLSVRQVRTAINHLKSTHEVTNYSTPKFTIFTVVNYKKFQSSNTVIDTQATRYRHAVDTQATTTKEVKNIRSKEVKKCSRTTLPKIDEVISYCQGKGYTFNYQKFFSHYQSIGWKFNGQPMDWRAKADEWQATEKTEPVAKSSYDIEQYENFSIFD